MPTPFEVNDYFERIEDSVHGSSFDGRSRQLLEAAKRSIGALHAVAERLGAQAAYQEAESSARFREEEKRWAPGKSLKGRFRGELKASKGLYKGH